MTKINGHHRSSVIKMVRRGMTYESVAAFYGVSRQRIWQIVKEAGGIRKKDKKETPTKSKIRQLINIAVRKGVLIQQPCEICGISGQKHNIRNGIKIPYSVTHAHHDDYNKPLDVRWLCQKHHKEWHQNNKPIPLKK